jgi:DNA replication initiation complex subunit (GINS family)
MITYKELRNFQRLERENNDLQDLGPTFMADVLGYLNEKREALKDSKGKESIFSKDAQTEIRSELRNAIVVIQDIYERRERKILGQAVLAVKTDSSVQDTTKMLDFEKEMYSEMIGLLRRYRGKFFGQKKRPEQPSQEQLQPEPPSAEPEPPSAEPEPAPEQEPTDEPVQPPERPALAEQPPEQTSSSSKQPGLQTIRITKEMPQFMWEDGKTYGPFKEEDVVNIDSKLASMLIQRESAEEL